MTFKGEEKFYPNDFLGYKLTDDEKEIVNSYTVQLMNPAVCNIEVGIDAFFNGHVEYMGIAKERAEVFGNREPNPEYDSSVEEKLQALNNISEVYKTKTEKIIYMPGLDKKVEREYKKAVNF